MTLSGKAILVILLVALSLPASATLSDTISKKKVIPARITGFQNESFLEYIKEGSTSIKQDSVAKGINLIATALNHMDDKQNISGLLSYQIYELFELIKLLDSDKLTIAEKQLGYAFIKAIVSESKTPYLKSGSYSSLVKQAGNTAFCKRVNLLSLYFYDKKKAMLEVDKLLTENAAITGLVKLKTEQAFMDNNYQESINYGSKAIAAFPKYKLALFIVGKSYLELEDYAKAIPYFDDLLKEYPNSCEALHDRAGAFYQLEKYDRAITDYKAAYMVNPVYKTANYYIARTYKQMEKLDSALYYTDEYIKQYPDDAYGYNMKGDIFYDSDDYTNAINYYTRAVDIESGDADLYEDRGNAYFYSGETDKALADFEAALKIDKQPYVYDRLADCMRNKGSYQKAIDYYRKAIKLDPQYKYAYVGLNICYNNLKKFPEAVAASQKAIGIDSTYSTAIGNLGWTYYCMGNDDACITYSYKALNYDKEATYAMFNIALATLRKGEIEKAKNLYRNFYDECKQHNYEINDGAITDLRDLIKQNIAVKEAEWIIQNIFQQSL